MGSVSGIIRSLVESFDTVEGKVEAACRLGSWTRRGTISKASPGSAMPHTRRRPSTRTAMLRIEGQDISENCSAADLRINQ